MDEKVINELIEREIYGCFRFFWDTSNHDLSTKGYGLSLDTTKKSDTASIASVGYALAAYVIGVERGYVSKEEAYNHTLKTLQSIQQNVEKHNGFYVHFLHMKTAETKGKDIGRPSEYSTIDTAILLMGVLAAMEYFQGDVYKEGLQMLEEVNWEWLVKDVYGKKIFWMSYNPVRNKENDGFSKATWDHYAEQLMMYFLYAGQEEADPELARALYWGFHRNIGAYKGENYVYCYNNALFIHQFSHLFIDFNKYLDFKGFNWHTNSKHATLANKTWCQDNPSYETFKQGYWGLTASHSKFGYSVVGGPPWGFNHYDHFPKKLDGTVAPYASLTSIMFTPKESIEQLCKFAQDDEMWGEYGLYDAFNFEEEKWYSKTYIGIDKGPTIIALDNYQHNTIINLVTNSAYIQKALQVLMFKENKEVK